MTAIIQAQELGKRYGRRWALTDCTLAIPAGRVVAQDAPTYAGLSVADHLTLGARLNPGWDAALARHRIDRLGLDPAGKAGKLSGGQRAQLALTLGIAKRPKLLILAASPMPSSVRVSVAAFQRCDDKLADQQGVRTAIAQDRSDGRNAGRRDRLRRGERFLRGRVDPRATRST